MWISNDLRIGNDNADYSIEDWNKVYASIKVNVSGDFTEKVLSLSTPDNCFITEKVISNATLNTNMTSEELQTCVDYISSFGFPGDATAYCSGANTEFGTFQENLDNDELPQQYIDYFFEHNIINGEEASKIIDYDSSCGSEVVIPNNLPLAIYLLNTNMTSEELQTCANYLTDRWGVEEEGNTVDVGETYQAFCQGTGTNHGETFQAIVDNGWWNLEDLAYFKEHNIITSIQSTNKYPVRLLDEDVFKGKNVTSANIPLNASVTTGEDFDAFDAGTTITKGNTTKVCYTNESCFTTTISNNEVTITDYDSSCGGVVRIPNEINGKSVTTIGDYAFSSNQLTSVNIPDSVTTIGKFAFSSNQLTSIDIPNSVTTIGSSAFAENQFTSLTLGNSVTTIGYAAFENNQLTSVSIPNSVTTIGDGAFAENQLTSVTIPSSVIEYYCSSFDVNVNVIKENSSLICTEEEFHEG